MVLIHHTRKMTADDPFDTISGTQGIGGAADAMLLLARADGGGTLFVCGRDLEEHTLTMTFERVL